jgi:hypothetical protein
MSSLVSRLRAAHATSGATALATPRLFEPATPAPARPSPPPLELLSTLEATLAAAPRLDEANRAGKRRAYGHGYTVYADAASGRRVHVAPSRWKDGLYILAADDMDTECHEGIMALRARLSRGGLDPDAAIWRVELARWDGGVTGASV